MIISRGENMMNEQAHEMVLTWCRSENANRNGRRPVMRTMQRAHGIVCRVIDASYIDTSCEGAVLATGYDWVDVVAALGVYGPQWEPAPVKRADPPPHYGYRHRPVSRRYGRR